MDSKFYRYQDSTRYASPYNTNNANTNASNNQNVSKVDTNCEVNKKRESYIVGNSVTFSVNDCDSEIKADAVVSYRDSVRVWGQVKDCAGKPVSYAYVKLLKVTCNGLVGIAHTVTDCLGFYQFDICDKNNNDKYTILIGKAATGTERVVTDGTLGLNCNPHCSKRNTCN